MPLKGYIVWKSTIKKWNPRETPGHGHIKFDDGKTSNGKLWDAAVNVESKSTDSRLVFWLNRDIPASHPLIAPLADLPFGKAKGKNPGPPGLDFLRGAAKGIIDISKGLLLHGTEPGPDNDILDFVNPVLNQAVAAGKNADLYLFGEPYSDGTGIHDIHMNQGNKGQWARDNGVWQDGAIIIHFKDGSHDGKGHWEGIFLAFAVQTPQTSDKGGPVGKSFGEIFDERGGDDGGDGGDGGDDQDNDGMFKGKLSVLAALVNPLGPDNNPTSGDPETVHLVNRTTTAVKLGSWKITNGGAGGSFTLPGSAVIAAGGKLPIPVGPDCPLGNKGGEIVLMDHTGKVVDTVKYSKDQAAREGVLLYFQQRD
ncbi:hypothetical protein RB595_008096 [Gaeumannomyces hyphopodioides]